MREPEAVRAVAAATSLAASLGLPADEAAVLHDSNKLTLRLLPADTVARVAPVADQVAAFEVGLARRLAAAGCPVGAPDPRVEPRAHERDGFVITLWTFYAPVAPYEVRPAGFARALARLHAGMRHVDAPAPRFTERVERARRFLADHGRTPGLTPADRALLQETLGGTAEWIAARGAPEQLLHGEPHPGNVLATEAGPLFIDWETCCRGPVEFDLAHAPEGVGAHYPGVDAELLRRCRLLVLAIVTVWRWDREDLFPDGHRLGLEQLGRIRAAATEN
ncbi:phosphotransferase enzyme family protein [Streptomyces sp. BBFR102]|uniref:phosphotransferase enzyme family protein n=1 Tax=Streptomyces sp. BBFR102 TaxID=3448171 RepID=UPI003F538C06